jgi:DNA-binding NarL/FixJ family response regulator
MDGASVIRILIADDHPIMRRGLTEEINQHDDMRVVCEATNGREAVALYKQHRPDLAILDLHMPELDGIAAIAQIRDFSPVARTILLTTAMGDVQILQAFKSGAYSCVLKNMMRTDLLDVIRTVAGGQRRIPSDIVTLLAEHALTDSLSGREVAVLTSASNGNSNKMIGEELHLSEHTVKTHVKSILQKLGASDRTHAVMIALRRGYIHLRDRN